MYDIYIGGIIINYIDCRNGNRIIALIKNCIFIRNELKETNDLLSNVNGYSLDSEQRIAIIIDECACLIVAGAGSGKSLTMIGKIRYLIERKKIKDDEILCLSFTKEASLSLEKNIKKNYGYNIKVFTFHKLALELLKDKNYRISDPKMLEYVVDEYFYLADYNLDIKLKIKKILCRIDEPYHRILNSKELMNLKTLIITFINLFKTNNYKLNDFIRFKGNKDILRIIIDIYVLYESELKSKNEIDFNDMIILATEYVNNNKIKKYKYIIVDEYQDTSYIRFLLLKSVIEKTGAKIVCVGDDYQSIYRFNGCNLNMFLDFKKLFKCSKVLRITHTYRNSQQLINVAGNFIMKNKRQMFKELKSNKTMEKPIKIRYGNDLKCLLDYVYKYHNKVLVLGRNNSDINQYFSVINGAFEYNGRVNKYLTVHASKGLEEECVVIINLKDDLLGFPSRIKDDKILDNVNNGNDIYPYEEERRLFYVALTRTKSDVYLLVDKNNPSIFIKEVIKDYSRYIEYI